MPERSLGEWLQHLERIHPAEIDLGLSRTAQVARALDLLPYPLTVLTVAGTNGKGSVVSCSDALLRGHGLRTGRYTSPHLHEFNERIVIDGRPVASEAIVDAFAAIEAARGEITLTYFEFATLAALWLFRCEAVDVAILEVGLGGRLDAVNIVDCDIAVITCIDLDHQHWLGDTVEKIAPEKAAVARSGRPVVLAESSYPRTLFTTLAAIGATPLRAGDHWSWRPAGAEVAVALDGARDPILVPVPPGLLPVNVAAAVRACAFLLRERFDRTVAAAALDSLVVPGRRQLVRYEGREVLLDVAHNEGGMRALVAFLDELPPARTVAAFGAMKDKDLVSMAACLARAVDGACAVTIPGVARAAEPEAVWRALDAAGIAIAQDDFTFEAVWQQMLGRSAPGDRLVICGSFHTVAGILALLPPEFRA